MKEDINIQRISLAYGIQILTLIIISLVNPLNMYAVSPYTYFLIIVCTISFIIAFNKISRYIIKSKQDFFEIENKKLISLDKFLQSKILMILIILILMAVIYYLIKYNIIIKNLSKLQVRMVRFRELFDNSKEALFFNYIIAGSMYIISIIFSIMLVNKKIKNPVFILMAILIILYSLIGYSRMIYLNIAIYIFINILLKPNLKELINIKNIVKIVFLSIVVGIILFGMLYVRTCKSSAPIKYNMKKTLKSQTEQILEYAVGGFRLLDNFIENGFENFPQKYTFGQATFAGIEEIVLYPIKGIGIKINSFNNIIGQYTQKPVQIGENTNFNAFYTCIMNFYLDYGLLGVILFPILHSILIIFALNQYYHKKDIYSFMLLNFVLLNLFFSIVRWNYQSGTSVFVLIVLLVKVFFTNNIVTVKNKIKKQFLKL